jgi:S1-C subfamily serine protease
MRGSLLIIFLSIAPSHLVAQNTSVSAVAQQEARSVVLIVTSDKAGGLLGAGSGFVVRTDGVIVTNYHVIDGAYTALVKTPDGDIYDGANVLDADVRRDIAILKVKALGLPVSKLGSSLAVKVGQHVVAIGNPRGVFTGTVSDGIISAIRQLEGFHMFQTTAPISHGSSGGPLLNDAGEVIGITSETVQDAQNLNLAIPVDYIKPLLREVDIAHAQRLADFNAGKLQTATPQEGTSSLVDGGWSATMADSKGSAKLTVNLIQNAQGEVVGTYSSSTGAGGTIRGSLKDHELTFEVTQTAQNCPGIFKGKGTLQGPTFTGTFAGTDCAGQHANGSLAMSRNTGELTATVPTSAAPRGSIPQTAADQMRDGVVSFLDKRLGVLAPDTAMAFMGSPKAHRFGYAPNNVVVGDIYGYSDPTQVYRTVELNFEPKTGLLGAFYVYPYQMSWEQCRKLWGDSVRKTKNPDGTRFYSYVNRRLNVLLDKDEHVISLGIYAGVQR